MGGRTARAPRSSAHRAQRDRPRGVRARPRRGAPPLNATAAAPGTRFVALLIAIGWVAAVIALWGLVALASNTDPIAEADAGPFLGPVQVVAGGVIVLVVLLRTARGLGALSASAAGVAGVYLSMLVVGAFGYAMLRGGAGQGILFLGAHATSVFSLGAALLALPAVLLERIVVVRAQRTAEGRRPFDRPQHHD